MMQMNSAGAILAGPAREKGPAKGAESGEDAGVFSQEFENQVKKASEGSAGESRQTTAESADKAETKAEAAPAEEAEATAGSGVKPSAGEEKAEEAETGEEEGGKMLPPELAAAPEEGGAPSEGARREPVEAVEMAPVDTADEIAVPVDVPQREAILRLLNGGREARGDAEMAKSGSTHAASVVQTASSAATTDAGGKTVAEEAAEFSTMRLRDMLSQRMGGGEMSQGGGDAAAGNRGKLELGAMMAIQQAQSRGAGGFEEALKLTGAGAVSNPVANASQPAAASVPVAMTLAVPVQQQGWGEAMGERVVWMARSNIQQAQIQLNPRELGPIEIKISMQNDQTNVNFVAHHATTRDALEAAIPRLRDMFNQQGLDLGQADVSQHSFGDGREQATASRDGNLPGTHAGELGEGEVAEEQVVVQQVGHVAASGVDYFA